MKGSDTCNVLGQKVNRDAAKITDRVLSEGARHGRRGRRLAARTDAVRSRYSQPAQAEASPSLHNNENEGRGQGAGGRRMLKQTRL